MLIFSLFSILLQRNSVLSVTVYILSGYPCLIFLLYLSQPFKCHVFESRDILINIFITSIIQFSKIYLTIAKFENNPVFASTGTVKSQKQLYKNNPESIHRILPLPRHIHTKPLPPADIRAVEQRTQIYTRS